MNIAKERLVKRTNGFARAQKYHKKQVEEQLQSEGDEVDLMR